MNYNAKQTQKWQGQRGNAILEFAMIVPFMIGITLGVIEVGRYAYFGLVVANAARAGASYGSQLIETANDTAGMKAAATNDFGSGWGTLSFPSDPSASCKCWSGTAFTGSCTSSFTCASGSPIYYVTVPVSATANALFNLPFIPATMTVAKTATMRVQNPSK